MASVISGKNPKISFRKTRLSSYHLTLKETNLEQLRIVKYLPEAVLSTKRLKQVEFLHPTLTWICSLVKKLRYVMITIDCIK